MTSLKHLINPIKPFRTDGRFRPKYENPCTAYWIHRLKVLAVSIVYLLFKENKK